MRREVKKESGSQFERKTDERFRKKIVRSVFITHSTFKNSRKSVLHEKIVIFKLMDAMDGEIDSILLSKRILADIGECKDFISGGILISNTNGTIKKIFTSQQEINSYLFRAHGTEVSDER